MWVRQEQEYLLKPRNVSNLSINNRYRKKTVGFWIYDQLSGDKIVNIARNGVGDFVGVKADIASGILSRSTDKTGTCLQGVSNATEADLPNGTPGHSRFQAALSKGYTLVFAAKRGTEVLGGQDLFGIGGPTNGIGLIYKIVPHQLGYYHISSTGADLSAVNGANTISQDEYFVVAISADKNGNFKSYLNGKLDYSTTGLGTVEYRTAAPLLLGSNISSTNNWEGKFFAYAFMDESSTDAELKALSLNPWRELLVPKKPYLPMYVAAGGGFIAAWAKPRSRVIGGGLR